MKNQRAVAAALSVGKLRMPRSAVISTRAGVHGYGTILIFILVCPFIGEKPL